MICPYCGNSMKPDQVFCEKCGKEKLLVPVFEPEIEEQVAISMSSIAQDLSPDSISKKDTIKKLHNDDNAQKTQTKNPIHFWISATIAVLILITSFSLFFFYYTKNSYSYQFSKAETFYTKEDWNSAIYYADRAIELNAKDVDARLLKIHAYERQNNIDKVLEKCEQLLKITTSNKEAYETFIPYLIKMENYNKLQQILAQCEVESIVEKYYDYTAFVPEFDEKGGEYDEHIMLRLIASGTGNIYYTLDGTEPNKYSERYIMPIKLTSNNYNVKAVYINNYGISSEVVSEKYTINSNKVLEPEISVASGNYEEPMMIKISNLAKDNAVYYTTDGTIPTIDSIPFTTPIPMPLGKSEFKFLMVDSNGTESEIAIRNYDCNLNASYTSEQAVTYLMQNLIVKGTITDILGSVEGKLEKKQYLCTSAISKDATSYYLILEYKLNEKGNLIKTGDMYAVGINDLQIFRAYQSTSENITLENF